MQGGNFTAAMVAVAPHFGLDAALKKKLIIGYSGLCAPGPVSVAGLPLITATWVHSSHSQ